MMKGELKKMENQIRTGMFDIISKTLGLEPTFLSGKGGEFASSDGELTLRAQSGQTYRFDAYQKKEIRPFQLIIILEMKRKYRDLIVLADEIFPRVKEELRKKDVNYIDGAGNAFIKNKNLYLFIDGKRRQGESTNKSRLFSRAGLQVVYHILVNNDLINKPYRDIAAQANVALDTISKTMNGLKSHGYVMSINKDFQKLFKKDELLEKWVEHYNDRLKPKLYLDSFRFKEEDVNFRWKNITLDRTKTCWGGEPAASLLTDYLKPEIFILYTKEPRGDLIKHYRLIPDPRGKVKVYHPFWQIQETQTAPPLVVYADLIGTGDSRNIETANIMLSKHLANLI
jgi:hypothetical protein